jgi:hypothetical protein
MTDKRRYYKLDDIGFVGTQEKRSAAQIKADALRTANIIKAMKETRQAKEPTVSKRKAAKVK